jgi:hypothetical protein
MKLMGGILVMHCFLFLNFLGLWLMLGRRMNLVFDNLILTVQVLLNLFNLLILIFR